MVETVPAGLMQATEIARQSKLRQSSNGLRFASFGENNIESADLERIVQAVPERIARRLGLKAYYFVPLALMERVDDSGQPIASGTLELDPDQAPDQVPDQSPGRDTMIATKYTVELSDRAICHRNVRLDAAPLTGIAANEGNADQGAADQGAADQGNIDGVFISTRLLADRFALAFEFFINVGHAFVDVDGVPSEFSELIWKQALAAVRGETSLDAWESRALALPSQDATTGDTPLPDEKAKLDFFEAAFSDTVAIYLLSLAIDFDYAELRERDYPLLAPTALADRLRLAARLFPPNAGYDFSVRYRRRK